MKIVCISNFDDPTISDELICENVNKDYGERITEALNDSTLAPTSSYFYVLKEDDYKLYDSATLY